MNTEENDSMSERALSCPSTHRVEYQDHDKSFKITPQLMDLESCSDGNSTIISSSSQIELLFSQFEVS